jgi:hypothetical protein
MTMRTQREIPPVTSPRPKRPDLLARWSRAAIPVRPSVADPAHRERVMNAIVRTMKSANAERSARRRARRRIAFAAGIAAVLVMVIGLGREWAAGGRLASRSGSPVGGSHAVDTGAQAVASRSDSGSTLRLPSGVVVTMTPETRFQMSDLSAPTNAREELVIELGVLHVEVPKLPAGHTFAVRTPDAIVTVHGTSFSVEVTKAGPPGATTTTVVVAHGVVSVLHAGQEALLYAGMEWSSSGQLSVAASASADPRGRASSPPVSPPRLLHVAQDAGHHLDRRPADSTPVSAPVASATEASSKSVDLASQNALFAEAQLARKQGDPSRALRLLDDLVRRYPAALLTEDACVETFRLRAEIGDRAGAAREARHYLTLYRNGFARDEARDLALEPSSNY